MYCVKPAIYHKAASIFLKTQVGRFCFKSMSKKEKGKHFELIWIDYIYFKFRNNREQINKKNNWNQEQHNNN